MGNAVPLIATMPLALGLTCRSWVSGYAAMEPGSRDSRFFPLNGRYPKTQSANDRFGVSKPNARLRSGQDHQRKDGPSCKRSPARRNGRPADVRYLALIAMVAMTEMGTNRSFKTRRLNPNPPQPYGAIPSISRVCAKVASGRPISVPFSFFR